MFIKSFILNLRESCLMVISFSSLHRGEETELTGAVPAGRGLGSGAKRSLCLESYSRLSTGWATDGFHLGPKYELLELRDSRLSA